MPRKQSLFSFKEKLVIAMLILLAPFVGALIAFIQFTIHDFREYIRLLQALN